MALLASAVALFISLSDPGPGLFSTSWPFRLQTDAFLRGELALQRSPVGQKSDWAWHNGAHQPWGLGVPLVRLPFELGARWLGLPGAPDRLIFWLLLAAVTAVLWNSMRGLSRADRASLCILFIFNPAFVTLSRTRFLVYEESVAAAYLWGVLLLALLLRARRDATRLTLTCLGVVAGAAVLFRPTLVFVAVSTLLTMAMFLRRQTLVRSRVALLLGVAAMALTGALAMNALRFGSPFETGHLLNVSGYPKDQFAKVFGYPFRDEPLTRALAELASALFLAGESFNGADFYGAALQFQAPAARFRELYFSTFRLDTLLIALFGLVAATRKKRHPIARPMAIWGALSVGGLGAFYLWAPSMTSRYAIDFGPGLTALVAVAVLSGPLGGAGAARWRLVATMMWTLVSLGRSQVAPSHRRDAQSTVTMGSLNALKPVITSAEPALSRELRCHDGLGDEGILHNRVGWFYRDSCRVAEAVTLYLPASSCVELICAGGRADDFEKIRVKSGLSELVLARQSTDGDETRLRFCGAPEAGGVQVVYIGFIAVAELGHRVSELELRAIRAE